MDAEILTLDDFRPTPEVITIKATDKFQLDLEPFSMDTKVDRATNDLVAGLLQGLHNLDVDTDDKIQHDRIMMIYDIIADILDDEWTKESI